MCVVDTSHVEEMRSHTVQNFRPKPDGKRAHARCKDRWENIKLNLRLWGWAMDSRRYETNGGLLWTIYRNVGCHESRKFLGQLNNYQSFKKVCVWEQYLKTGLQFTSITARVTDKLKFPVETGDVQALFLGRTWPCIAYLVDIDLRSFTIDYLSHTNSSVYLSHVGINLKPRAYVWIFTW